MQANKTDKFVYLFARFILYTMAINKENFTADHIIRAVEEIQSGFVIYRLVIIDIESSCFFFRLWVNILNNFVIPEAPKFPPKDRKLAAIGITRLICESTFMLQETLVRSWLSLPRKADTRTHQTSGLRLTLLLESCLVNASIWKQKKKNGFHIQIGFTQESRSRTVFHFPY